MQLAVRNLMLQADVIHKNKYALNEQARQNMYRLARNLGLPPQHRIVQQVEMYIKKGVRLLRTKDEMLLNLAPVLLTKYNIRVERCN